MPLQNSISKTPNIDKQYKEAIDISSIVSKTNLDGIITYINNNFVKISGYVENELVGKSHNIISHPDTPPELFTDLWKTISSKKIWHGQLNNLSKDGTKYTVDCTIIPIVDLNNEIVEYISIRKDITQLIQQKSIIVRQTTDPLTGLYNREKLIEEIAKIQDPNLALINLKNFRDVNELYGFEIGDTLIIKISEIIQNVLKDSTYSLYRLPSDEFAVLRDKHDENLIEFQEKILSILNKLESTDILIKDYKINVAATAGISSSKINILMNADIALQNAKHEKKSFTINNKSSHTEENLHNNLLWNNRIKNISP